MEEDFFEHSSSVPPNLAAGMRIGGKYELVRRIGSGAMGEVWAALHLTLREEVALKIVLRDVMHPDGTSSDSRFVLEARVAAQLSRKTRHIVSVTDHGEDGRYAYLAMELLKGESLEDRLERSGPMPLAKVIPIIYQIARALAVAHADGVLHRDLKPTNVFVTVDEEGRAVIKILDFGIAKLRASMRRIPVSSKHTTLRGFLLGTPTYMSPEQARARSIDHRTDVWALAVIAYHLLTKQFPFDGETPELLIANLCHGEPVPIHHFRPELPLAVEELFARAFSESIDERFQSAVAFAGALEHLETLSRRLGSGPAAMGAISLPPPPMVTERIAVVTAPIVLSAKREGSSIIAAGVPRKGDRRLTGALFGVAAVSLLLLLFISLRPTQPAPAGLAAAPTMPLAMTTLAQSDIPPPVELPPLIESRPRLPATMAKATRVRMLAPPPEPVPVAAPTPTPAPAPAPVAAPPHSLDRSEVF